MFLDAIGLREGWLYWPYVQFVNWAFDVAFGIGFWDRFNFWPRCLLHRGLKKTGIGLLAASSVGIFRKATLNPANHYQPLIS